MYGLGDDLAELSSKLKKLKAKAKADAEAHRVETEILKSCIGRNDTTGMSLYSARMRLNNIKKILDGITIHPECTEILSWRFELGDPAALVAKGDNIKNNIYLPMTPYEVSSSLSTLTSTLSRVLKELQNLASACDSDAC
jgi:hypothetical protein